MSIVDPRKSITSSSSSPCSFSPWFSPFCCVFDVAEMMCSILEDVESTVTLLLLLLLPIDFGNVNLHHHSPLLVFVVVVVVTAGDDFS